MVPVHVPLLQLPARLVLLAAVAVAVGGGRSRWPPAVLLVVPVALVMDVLFGAAVGLVLECRPSLGVVQGFEVVAVGSLSDGALRRHHLQAGSDAVVARAHVVTEVDDAALVGALVRRLDPGEPQFMGDVASYNLNNLVEIKQMKINK